jgi:hypothetical protein
MLGRIRRKLGSWTAFQQMLGRIRRKLGSRAFQNLGSWTIFGP